VLDDYRDHWRGISPDRQEAVVAGKFSRLPPPSFLTKEQQVTAGAQYQRLQRLPYAAALLGQGTVDYAKDHPDDPEVPEALTLRARTPPYGFAGWGKDAQGAAARNTAVS
jgi:hypothetical protein